MLLRTGVTLPHLSVHAGQTYEVEDHHPEGLYIKGVPEGLDPASFEPVGEPI